jgi:hypothetical protein
MATMGIQVMMMMMMTTTIPMETMMVTIAMVEVLVKMRTMWILPAPALVQVLPLMMKKLKG